MVFQGAILNFHVRLAECKRPGNTLDLGPQQILGPQMSSEAVKNADEVQEMSKLKAFLELKI